MEKIKKVIEILKLKWLRQTATTAVIIVALVTIFFAINLIVEKLNPNDIDLTPDGLHSLTDESKEIISSIPKEEKFKIYLFDYDDDTAIVDMARQYERINDSISVEIVDMEERPDLVSKYKVESGNGAIVIAAGDKQKTFSYYDLYTQDYTTGESVDITEQRFTNGIVALSSKGKITTLYALTGHGELSMSKDMTLFKTGLELANYEVKDLDLLTATNVPEDCMTLIISSPKKDFTEFETNAIKEYIKRGGEILWYCNPYSSEGETPNINSILDSYGVKVRQDGFMLEQDTSKVVMGSPDLIIVDVEQTGLMPEGSKVLVMDSGKLEIKDQSELTDSMIMRTDLLTTSDTSFFRTNLELGATPKISESDGEKTQKAVVGTLLEKPAGDGSENSGLIIFANNYIVQDAGIITGSAVYSGIGFYDNKDLSLNCIRYLTKTADADQMTITKEIKTVKYVATGTRRFNYKNNNLYSTSSYNSSRNYSLGIKKKKKIKLKDIILKGFSYDLWGAFSMKILSSVFVIIGVIIGAGFASGKEIYTFFFIYGKYGILGMIISISLISFIIYKTLKIIKKHDISSYDDFLDKIIGNTQNKNIDIKTIINFIINVFLLMTFFVMCAGFSAYFEQQLGINKIVMGVIASILCFFILNKSTKGLFLLSSVLIPIVVIILLILGIKTFNTNFGIMPISQKGNPIISGILYASYNSITLVSVLIPIKQYISKNTDILKISFFCMLIILALSLIVFMMLLAINEDISKIELPTVYVANSLGAVYKYLYGFIILSAILTTQVSSAYGFLNNIAKNKKKYKMYNLIICIAAMFMPLFGFSNLVNYLYPMFGILGLIQLVGITFARKQ